MYTSYTYTKSASLHHQYDVIRVYQVDAWLKEIPISGLGYIAILYFNTLNLSCKLCITRLKDQHIQHIFTVYFDFIITHLQLQNYSSSNGIDTMRYIVLATWAYVTIRYSIAPQTKLSFELWTLKVIVETNRFVN